MEQSQAVFQSQVFIPEEEFLRECQQSKPFIPITDFLGMDETVQQLREYIELPLRFPQIFQGSRRMHGSLFLYGPPGVGKSALINSIGTSAGCTFLTVSIPSLITKYPSFPATNALRFIYEYANSHSPALIFLEEIDLVSRRSGDGNFSYKEIRTELLILTQERGNLQVYTVAASAYPGMLDCGLRRRFEKRVWMPMPEANTRKELIRRCVRKASGTISEEQLVKITDSTERYTVEELIFLVQRLLRNRIKSLSTCSISSDSVTQQSKEEIGSFHSIDSVLNKQRDIDYELRHTRPRVTPDMLLSFNSFRDDFG